MIERTHYHRAIRSFIDKPIIKVITGIRRSGKSTFLAQLQDNLLKSGILDEGLHEMVVM